MSPPEVLTTKRTFFERVVAELNLDISNPHTLLLANAFALVDQRDNFRAHIDNLETTLAVREGEIATLEAALSAATRDAERYRWLRKLVRVVERKGYRFLRLPEFQETNARNFHRGSICGHLDNEIAWQIETFPDDAALAANGGKGNG